MNSRESLRKIVFNDWRRLYPIFEQGAVGAWKFGFLEQVREGRRKNEM